ncbi:MAG: CaiB/BaiF CoA transferase family protein [Candidatus Binatia bacterium]
MASSEAFTLAALGNLRLLECGTAVAGAFCARVFADFGAEVIKVEPPGGDPLRTYGPFPGDQPHPERSALFAYLNAGKQSVVLDNRRSADREMIARLAKAADVFITSSSAGERTQWGLDPDALGATNPGLVTVSLSAFGERGPLSKQRAREINVCAMTGASVILGEPRRTPLSFPFSLPALQAGLHGAAAALTALLARRRDGRGQCIEVSEADVLAYYTGGMSLYILGGGGKWRRQGLERHGTIYPSGFYPCKDGFIFIATQTRAQWKGFLQLMGDPDWAREDPVLQDGVAIGWKRADEVDVHFIPWLTQYTRSELTEMARQANLVLGPINTVSDLPSDTHLQARDFWGEIQLDGRPLRVPGMGYRMSATPWRIGQPPKLETAGRARCYSVRQQSVAATLHPLLPDSRHRPLAGYRAIEFGWNWAGPLVGQIFADLGMEVIKVETQERLDFMRHWAHAHRFFHNANRGKLSIAVNLKKPGGVDLIRRLVRHADIVFDNFAAGVMARNGLDYEPLRAVKPDLIVLSMAMAGQDGPLRHLRGFATIATGFAGLEALVGYPETGPTGFQLLGIGDTNAAIQGVVAALTALWHRGRTGQGQFIDLSQIEAATTLMAEPLSDFQLNGRVAGPQANQHPWMAPHGIYPAAGHNRWVALAVDGDAEWAALVRAMGEPAWARDEALVTASARQARRTEIDGHLAEWTAQFDRDDGVARLQQAGVAAAPVLEIDEVRTHPHFQQRQLSQDVESFEGGPALVYNTPWHFSATPCGVDRPSPRIGEHTEYVFETLLGMSAAEIQGLVEQRVMW